MLLTFDTNRQVGAAQRLIFKISDFALSRQLVNRPYQMSDKVVDTHIYQMAPESLCMMEFTTKSDVWAFGIVMWQIFSIGELPYQGIENLTPNQLLYMLEDFQLERPKSLENNVCM